MLYDLGMIIVLEGVDATGKSTLAQKAKQYYPAASLHHFGPPQSHPLKEYSFPAQHASIFDGVTVFDRYHWGELVYGPRYRGESLLGPEGFLWVELLLESRGAVTVVTTGDPDRILERVQKLEDDFVRMDRDHLKEMQDHFVDLIPHAATPIFRHDIDDGLIVSAPELVATARRRGRIREDIIAWYPEFIGSPYPDALLVGDRAEYIDGHVFPFTPYPNTPGRYLMSSLLHTPIARSVGIVNARSTISGAQNSISNLIKLLHGPPVVALSERASTILKTQKVEHRLIDSPETHARFVRRPEAYAEFLMRGVDQ